MEAAGAVRTSQCLAGWTSAGQGAAAPSDLSEPLTRRSSIMRCCTGRCSLICLCALQLVSDSRAPALAHPGALGGSQTRGTLAGPHRLPRRPSLRCPLLAVPSSWSLRPREGAVCSFSPELPGSPRGVAEVPGLRATGCGSELFPPPLSGPPFAASAPFLLKFL